MAKENGFSLVELLTVIVILGILLGIGTYSLFNLINLAQDLVDRITGEELFNGVFEVGSINTSYHSGTNTQAGENNNSPSSMKNIMRSPGYIQVEPDTNYLVKNHEAAGNFLRVYFYDQSGKYLGVTASPSFKTASDVASIRLRLTRDQEKLFKPEESGPFFSEVSVEKE